MKTMTCSQMGGPCDAPFTGNTADDVIKAQDKHLKEMVAKGDETHKSALAMMQDRVDCIDYVEIRAADSLRLVERLEKPAVILAAASVGATRLIDNMRLG